VRAAHVDSVNSGGGGGGGGAARTGPRYNHRGPPLNCGRVTRKYRAPNCKSLPKHRGPRDKIWLETCGERNAARDTLKFPFRITNRICFCCDISDKHVNALPLYVEHNVGDQ
jgi:hypothetical protein